MKIVIDIPDEVAKENTPKAYFEYFGAWSSNLTKAFENGAVLPKGHGDLIDRDYFMDKYAGCGNEYCEDTSCKDCNSRIVNKFDVDSAPVIIPADR